jgi:hypothetical protein
MSLHIALAAEIHLAEEFVLKLWFAINVEQSVIIQVIRSLTESNMEDQIILIIIIICIIMPLLCSVVKHFFISFQF